MSPTEQLFRALMLAMEWLYREGGVVPSSTYNTKQSDSVILLGRYLGLTEQTESGLTQLTTAGSLLGGALSKFSDVLEKSASLALRMRGNSDRIRFFFKSLGVRLGDKMDAFVFAYHKWLRDKVYAERDQVAVGLAEATEKLGITSDHVFPPATQAKLTALLMDILSEVEIPEKLIQWLEENLDEIQIHPDPFSRNHFVIHLRDPKSDHAVDFRGVTTGTPRWLAVMLRPRILHLKNLMEGTDEPID